MKKPKKPTEEAEKMTVDRPILIAASVLTADISRLGEECKALEQAGVDRIQWGVMDGRFVPNLTLSLTLAITSGPKVRCDSQCERQGEFGI